MSLEIKSGVRVHVSVRSTVSGHQPGEKGTVMFGPIYHRTGSKPYYIVAMDKGDATTTTIFGIDEIEPDC